MYTPTLARVLAATAATATLTLGFAGVAAASTVTTEPPGADAPMSTEAGHSMDSMPATLEVDGSAEPSSPEAAAFCDAAVAAINAATGEDPEATGPAFEALAAAAPDDIAPAVDGLIANSEAGPGDPAFDEPYAAMLDYMRANCGFAELNVAASDYAFGGIPAELPAGPTIVALENIGAEVHEIVIFRINDESMTIDDILALPEEESESLVTFAGAAFGFPGTTNSTIIDLQPGNYAAACFLPEGSTPEVMSEMMEAEGPESSAPEGSAPEGSAPEGSGPGGEEGTPHFVLGMIHEFTVT